MVSGNFIFVGLVGGVSGKTQVAEIGGGRSAPSSYDYVNMLIAVSMNSICNVIQAYKYRMHPYREQVTPHAAYPRLSVCV